MKKWMLVLPVCGIGLSALAYQGANDVGDCELRAAFSKAIDWNETDQDVYTSTYDPHLGGLFSNTYHLDSDLVAVRLFIDRRNGYQSILDLGEGRTLTLLGYGSISGLNLGASDDTLWLKSGTIRLPATYPPASKSTCPNVTWPRFNESYASNGTLLIGGGASLAVLDAQEIQLLFGTNNWVIVTNNGLIAVSGSGTRIAGETGSVVTRPAAVLATGNGIRVTDGGVYSNSTAQADATQASMTLDLFGLAGCTGNTFEVTAGGKVEGWRRFVIGGGGNVLAFRGTATRQTFTANPSSGLFTIDGVGTSVEVTDGAHLDITQESGSNGRIWLGTNAHSCSNVIRVAGSGSRLTCSSVGFNFGQQDSSDNLMEVTDGGEAVMRFSSIGRGGASETPAKGNVLRVSGGGVYNDPSSLIIGYGDTGVSNGYVCSNRLEVISGGIVNANAFYIGYGTNSWGNSVDVSAGTVHVTNSCSFGLWGQSGRMTVRDGGMIDVGSAFNFGQATGVLTSNNVMEVLSGGEIRARQFVVCGTNHTIVVSNGTIRTVAGNAAGLQLPNGAAGRDRGLVLTLAGTNPVIRAEGTVSSGKVLSVRSDTVVNFQVPAGGYVAPPFQATAGELGFVATEDAVPDLRFDVSACGSSMFSCVLAEGAPLNVSEAVLTRARGNLPENCRLKIKGNQLVLKVNHLGFRFHVR